MNKEQNKWYHGSQALPQEPQFWLLKSAVSSFCNSQLFTTAIDVTSLPRWTSDHSTQLHGRMGKVCWELSDHGFLGDKNLDKLHKMWKRKEPRSAQYMLPSSTCRIPPHSCLSLEGKMFKSSPGDYHHSILQWPCIKLSFLEAELCFWCPVRVRPTPVCLVVSE